MINSNQLVSNKNLDPKELPLMAIISGTKNNSLKIRKFVFSESKSTTLVPNRKYFQYKPARLVVGKHRKYVTYSFRVPLDLPMELRYKHPPPGKFQVFKVFEGINRFKSDEFDQELVNKVAAALKEGFTPFKYEIEQWMDLKAQEVAEAKAKEHVISLNYATEKFLEQYKNPESKGQYRTVSNYLKEHLTSETELPTDQWYQSIKYLTEDDLLEFIQTYEDKKKWKENTYNDKVEKLITILEYCVSKKYITTNPAKALPKYAKGKIEKHEYYQDNFIPVVKKAMLDVPFWGKYLHRFCEVVYYTCTRTDQETRRLKIENIDWQLKQLHIPAEIAKGGRPRPIYLVPELEALFMSMNLKNLPGHYYIFGKDGEPGIAPTSEGFFSDIFRDDVRVPNDWSDKFTIYAWKHTRVVHLYLVGVPIAIIQQLCGHSSPSMTEKYLSRGLGIILGGLQHNVSRKF